MKRIRLLIIGLLVNVVMFSCTAESVSEVISSTEGEYTIESICNEDETKEPKEEPPGEGGAND